MTRLLKAHRDTICQALVHTATEATFNAHYKAMGELARDWQKALWGPHFDAIQAMPEMYFKMQATVYIRSSSGTVCLTNYVTNKKGETALKSLRLPHNWTHHYEAHIPPETLRDLYARTDEVKSQATVLESKRTTLQAQIEGALKKFSTVKKLKTEWPEAFKALPMSATEKPIPLPTVPVAKIQGMLADFPNGVTA